MANYTEKDFLAKGYTVHLTALTGEPHVYESKDSAKAEADRLRSCGMKASLLQKGKTFTVWYKKPAGEKVEPVEEKKVSKKSEKKSKVSEEKVLTAKYQPDGKTITVPSDEMKNFVENGTVPVMIDGGRKHFRLVRDDEAGLFVTIAHAKIYLEDFE